MFLEKSGVDTTANYRQVLDEAAVKLKSTSRGFEPISYAVLIQEQTNKRVRYFYFKLR